MVEEINKNTYLYVSSWRKNGGDCGLSDSRRSIFFDAGGHVVIGVGQQYLLDFF